MVLSYLLGLTLKRDPGTGHPYPYASEVEAHFPSLKNPMAGAGARATDETVTQ